MKPLRLAILALIVAGDVWAVEDPTAGGGQAGQFLSWGAGARALGMGKAFVGVADDASATYWNPAGMPQMERKELSALHAILWSQTSFDFLSFVYPHPTLGAFGGNITRLSSGGFEEVDADNKAGGTFSDNQTAFTAAYGRSLTEVVSVGFNLKYVAHTLGAFSNSFFGMDLSLMNRIPAFKGFRAGLRLSNLVAGTIGDTEDRLPVGARLGASYKTLKDKLMIALDLDQTLREKQRPGWHAGTEYWVLNYAALRLGFEGGKGAGLRETTAGLGVKYRDYGLDYAIGLHALGASHR
ncbi:MAG: PorV/PorQ family protein, partial [bacterium]